MSKKLTVVEKYEVIMEKAKDILTADELAFLRERADLHAKKNASRKPNKIQEENENIKTEILNFMKENKIYTITEIQKGVGLDSNQKTSALVRQLKENGLVARTESKGKAYFSKV
jgi:predicted transcriptional regulator